MTHPELFSAYITLLFSRLPDAPGLENWIGANSNGTRTYEQTAEEFAASEEFDKMQNLYLTPIISTLFIKTSSVETLILRD